MEKSGSKSLHLQGGAKEDHHLAISGCRNGHGPDLNGEPYALKGARTVRGGEALMRFLLHSRWRVFIYLALVLDRFCRRVLSWRVSITMEAAFCVETLEDALARHGRPDIFNTDQGS